MKPLDRDWLVRCLTHWMPPQEVMTSLPNHEQLIPLLLQYDVVGFQTDGDSGNFVRYLVSEDLRHEMPMFETSGHQVAFTLNGRRTRVGSFPVGIEPRSFQTLARRNVRSPFVKNLVTSLGGRTLIIGVDRLDYSKGLDLRMRAFEHFLGAHERWRNAVTYLQITPRSRSICPFRPAAT